MTVRDLVAGVVSVQADAPGAQHLAGAHFFRQVGHLGGEFFVGPAAFGGFAAGCGSFGREAFVQGVQRVNLDDVALHDGTQRAQFLFILADLGAVSGFRLREFVDELRNLFAGGIQLVVDGFIVAAQGGEILLEGHHLLGQFLFLVFQLSHQGAPLVQHITQHAGEDQGNHGQDGHHGAGTFLLFSFTLFAFDSFERIFSHNGWILKSYKYN